MYEGISPIDEMDGIYVKREDLAYWHSLDYPSGSKVRQYLKMAANHPLPPDDKEYIDVAWPQFAPCLVGCSANSCQQIYVAATGSLLRTKSFIFVPKRAVKTDATRYCEEMGAEVNEIKHGYPSVIRKHAKQRAVDLKNIIKWDRKLAILDTAEQCQNIPDDVKQIVVSTGSGLTAAGVMIGVAGRDIEVIAVATSPMVMGTGIRQLAQRYAPNRLTSDNLGELTFVPPRSPYDKHAIDILPDGTPLDPFYAAKAWPLVEKGQLFWPPGLRPVRSMPEECRKVFGHWKGPKVVNTSTS